MNFNADILIIVLVMAMMFLTFSLLVAYYVLKDKFKWFEKASASPIKYSLNVTNDAALKKILAAANKCSLEEKMIIIQALFGRPVRFATCTDKNGAWLEAVSYYAPEEGADASWYFERNKEKDKSIG